MGNDQRPTEDNSRRPGTQKQLQRATDAEPRDLEHDSLMDRQPVQLLQHWCDVVTTTGACDQADGSVLHRLEALK